MNLVWQRFTLSYLPLREYLNTSYLHRFLVGPLRSWRQTSLLMQWSEAIAALLLGLVYALAPFVPNALVGLFLVAGGAFWLLLTLSDEAAPANAPNITPIHLLVLLYWGISTVATALSPVKKAAFIGWGKLTLYLLLFALLARMLKSSRIRSWLITLYLHIALIVSIYGLRQWFFGAKALATWVDVESGLSGVTRVYSYLGNPNLLAGYLLPAVVLSLMATFVWQGRVNKALAVSVFIAYIACLLTACVLMITRGGWSGLMVAVIGLPIAVFLWQGRLKQALAMTFFIVNTACLILTSSRGGWIGLAVSLLAVLLLLWYWFNEQMPVFWRTWSIPIVLGSLAVMLLLAVIFVEPVRIRVLSIFAGRKDSSNNFRINVWMGVIDMIRDRPILGIGPGNTAFNKVYPIHQVNPSYTALSAYSIILEVMVETGIVGFFCFLWLLIVTFNQGWKQLLRLRNFSRREGFWLMGAIATLLGMLAHGTVDTVWYRPEVNTLWWLMVALIASYWTTSPQDKTKLINVPNPSGSAN